MSIGGWNLQKAVYGKLSADAALIALLGDPPRIHDDVPAGTILPYVQIGDSTEADWSTVSDLGSEHQLTIHAWSRGGGRMEARAILSAIHGALHDAPLAVENNRLVNLRFVLSQVLRETDGETYHGIARYRAVTEPISI